MKSQNGNWLLKEKASKRSLWLLPFLFLILMVAVISCRNDDDDKSAGENLVGLWQPYKMNQKATLSTGNFDQTTEFSICEQRARIIFGEDHTGSATTYSDTNGTCFQQDQSNFTYSYDDNTKKLTITNEDGSSQSGTVLQITNSDLVYELVGTYDFEGETNVQVKTTFYARKTKD